MSDFLKNLVGRSLGAIEVVRPRVPSIYEPYRRAGGLLGAPSVPRSAASEPEIETDVEGNANAARIDRQAGPPRTSESTVSPLLRTGSLNPTHLSTTAPARPGTHPDSRFGPLEVNRTHVPRRPETAPGTEVTRRGSEAAPAAESAISHSVACELAAPHESLVGEATLKQPQPVSSTVRPPLPSSWGTARSPDISSSANQPKPAIEVSIGKVEVRAVFPEPPVRRAPPQRSRPTVSLDDYLNRRNRGRR